MAKWNAGKRKAGGHKFSQVPRAQISRSAFDRSNGIKTTFDSGFLIPIMIDEALPGDTMSLSTVSFARMATPIHPIMDNQYLDIFWFAVPMRLLWDNWQKFMGEQRDPGDSTDFLIPTTTPPGGGYGEESLSDYFGIPTKEDIGAHSVMWHRAYNLIWNEWFRDENLQDSLVNNTHDGPDASTDYVIKRRGKRHDYFTSCLPFPQKGPSVELPIGTSAPVVSTGTGIPLFQTTVDTTARTLQQDAGFDNVHASIVGSLGDDDQDYLWLSTRLEADLSSATAATINEIRTAFQIQRLYERDARGGTRYTEIVRSHFGVTSPDQRLQRPEYLGGSSGPVTVMEVPQTAQGDGQPFNGVGTLGAYITSTAATRGFVKSFTEHCVIMGLCSIRADISYQQGLPRMMSRSTRWDFFWPALQHLGEQSVLNKEIFADGSANDELVFGYQERFAEYRYKPSMVTGIFRSNSTAPLDSWHLTQDFAAVPVLGDIFIQETPPIDRVVGVTSQPEWIFDAWFSYKCVRPMPTYSVPGLIDHF